MEIGDLNKVLPDVWFDWYVRFISGCLGIIGYSWLFEVSIELDFITVITFGVLGYIIGHISQPLSSCIVNKIFKNLKPRTDKFISKSYAETISMFNSALILSVLSIYYLLEKSLNMIGNSRFLTLLALILFLIIETYIKAKTTENKIKEIQDQEKQADTTDKENP